MNCQEKNSLAYLIWYHKGNTLLLNNVAKYTEAGYWQAEPEYLQLEVYGGFALALWSLAPTFAAK
jgi:hypothetical protein